MIMRKALALLTTGVALSLMLLAAVSGSTHVTQNFFLCNQGVWNQASSPGDVQINVCTGANGGQGGGNVQYEIKSNSAIVASGGCNIGPCSNPTVGGIANNSYIILRFSPSSISGIQVIEPDTNGNVQQVWVPYQYSSQLNCNPDYQFCFAPPSEGSAVTFTIVDTPITINVFFSLPS